MNWNQLRLTIWTKEEKPPGIQYQRILLISALPAPPISPAIAS